MLYLLMMECLLICFAFVLKRSTTLFGTKTLLLNDLMFLTSKAFSGLFLGFKMFEGLCVWIKL